MAVTAGAAGSGTVDDTGQSILGSNTCTAVWIKCLAGSANSLLVNIPALHGTSYLRLDAGDTFIGRAGDQSWASLIGTVNAKALDDSNDASISWGVSAKLG